MRGPTDLIRVSYKDKYSKWRTFYYSDFEHAKTKMTEQRDNETLNVEATSHIVWIPIKTTML